MSLINEKIFNMKRSKLISEQQVFQLKANFESQQEKLRMEQLKNKELIDQFEIKYQQTYEMCVKMSKLELVLLFLTIILLTNFKYFF